MQFASIMDYVQALFSFFIAPLIRHGRARECSGSGRLAPVDFGIAVVERFSSIGMWTWVRIDPTALRYVALSSHAKALAQDMYQALWSFVVCVVVTVVGESGDKTDA